MVKERLYRIIFRIMQQFNIMFDISLQEKGFMIFKELLLSVNFDDVVSHIGEIEKKQLDMVAHYKEVFDRLRLTPAIENDSKIVVSEDNLPTNSMENNEGIHIYVKGMHEESPGLTLGQQVVIEKDWPLEMVVANCLWEYTFYGFDDEDTSEYFGEKTPCTKYDLKSDLLQKRYYGRLLHYKNKEVRMQHHLAYSLDEWNKIHRIEEHGNRSKRKRAYRIEQRVDRLERCGMIERLIQRLITNPGVPSLQRKDLDYLFGTKSFDMLHYHSYANNINKRADYIMELIEKYAKDDYSGYDRYTIHIITSRLHPLQVYERSRFMTLIPTGKPVKLGTSYNEMFGNEIGFRIIMTRNEK